MQANVNQPISVKTARRKENRITFVSNVVVNSSISMNPTLGYGEAIKRDCLKMYVNGMGLRAIERVKGVHHTERNKLGKTSRKTVTRGL